MVTRRKIKAGELLHKEDVVIMGPRLISPALLCVGCYMKMDSKRMKRPVFFISYKKAYHPGPGTAHLINILKANKDKTGVINDPLGQPTVPAGSACGLILKFWDGCTDALCENSDHYQPGLWSASRIKKYQIP